MDAEALIVIGLAPFYSAAVIATFYGIGMLIRSFTESATQTALSETIPGGPAK